MCATFTDEDREKRVENANGEVIGTVSSIEGETAYVEPRPGVVDSIKSALGWGETTEDAVAIHEDTVAEISSETIRLESTTGDASTPDSTTDDTPAPESPSVDTSTPESTAADTSTSDPTTAEGTDGDPASKPARDADNAAERDPGTELETESTANAASADETANSMDGPGMDDSDDPGTTEPGAETSENETLESMNEGLADELAGSDAAPMADPTEEATETGTETETIEEPTATETSTEATEIETIESMDGVDDLPGTGISGEVGTRDTSEAIDQTEVQETEDDDASEGGQEGGTDSAASESTDLLDELDRGVDLEAALDPTDRETTGDRDRDDVAEALDRGSDLEAAMEDTDKRRRTGGSSPAESIDLADALDRGVDLEATAETSRGSQPDDRTEGEPSPTADDSIPPDAERESDIGIDHGLDIESAVESEPRSASSTESDVEIDPDAIAGGGTEGDETTEAEDGAARERLDDERTVERPGAGSEAERTAGDEGSTVESETETSEETHQTDHAHRRPGSPLTPLLAAQRAAVSSSQELALQGVIAQQRIAREAMETPLRAQRQGLEATQSMLRGSLTAFSALTGVGSGSSREGSQTNAAADRALEDARGEVDGEDLSEALPAHLEQLREMRIRLDELADTENEAAAALLERQIELLEACQQHLDADAERSDR